MQRFKGQAQLEYVLTGTLVLTVSIGALLLLGSDINKVLSGILSGTNQAAVASRSSQPTSVATSSSTGVPVKGSTFGTPTVGLAKPITLETLPKSSADLIMTVGVNGASQTTLALTDLIIQSAQTYQKSDPVAYNAIIKLGLKGQELAQMMKTCEAEPCDTGALDNLNFDVNEIYNDAFINTSDLQNRMKAEDIKLIANLTNISLAVADDFSTSKKGDYDPNTYHAFIPGADGDITDYPIGKSLVNPSTTVNHNSVVTQQCGLALACPK